MKVLITGVGGFIGSNLARHHLDKGDQVVGVDNFSTGKVSNVQDLPGLELIRVGLLESIDQLPVDVDVVYHFASPASPEKYMALAMNTMEVNTTGTLALLTYSRKIASRFVFASTSEIYGDPLVSPQPEEYWGNVNPIGPRSVYDEAKRFGETLVAHFQREQKVNAGIIRIFNTYGPNMDPFDGRVVSTFIRQALAGEPLTVFGDGAQTRSFCFIDDLIRGIVSMGVSDQAGPINLGNPEERNLLDLARIVLRITKSNSELKFLPLPEDDPKRRCPDITKAGELLNWSPEVGIEEGISRTAEWIESQNTTNR
jgi:nucleoside-diphosphate-sugar epimerase